MDERRAIQALTAGAEGIDGLVVGPGDDAAVLRPAPGEEIVWTTDVQAEGQHFFRRWLEMEQLGLRAIAVNLSDLAAMGARPWAYLLALGVPDNAGLEDLEDLGRGLREGEARWGIALAGGHTFRNPGGWMLVISMAGLVPEGLALRRDRARPGMGLWVSGALGAAARGLEILRSGRGGARSEEEEAAMRRWLAPEPRLALGRALAACGRNVAAIDISDGLSKDLHHLCRASGVGARLKGAKVPCHLCLSAFARARKRNLCLHGGEDYELLFAAPMDLDIEALGGDPPVCRVGEILPPAEGLVLVRADGTSTSLPEFGHDHFRSE